MSMKFVIGVNDPAPTQRPERGMRWARMKGGPQDGQWVQIPKSPDNSPMEKVRAGYVTKKSAAIAEAE